MYLLLEEPSTYSEMIRSFDEPTPTFEQLNVFGVTEIRLTVPQLSVEPLFTIAGVMLAVPAALSGTLMFWQMALGASLSLTVTVKLQLAELPAASVAVPTTVVVSIGKHVPEAGE